MRQLFFASLACLCMTMPLSAQIGVHLDNKGIGLHYRAHPEKKIAFEGNLSMGFAFNKEGLYYSQYSASAGIRWNFLRRKTFSLYSGFRGNLQLVLMHGDEFPVYWGGNYTQHLGLRSGINIGYTIPIGISWLMGEQQQWEWFLESGINRQYGRKPAFQGHLRVGATYYLHR